MEKQKLNTSLDEILSTLSKKTVIFSDTNKQDVETKELSQEEVVQATYKEIFNLLKKYPLIAENGIRDITKEIHKMDGVKRDFKESFKHSFEHHKESNRYLLIFSMMAFVYAPIFSMKFSWSLLPFIGLFKLSVFFFSLILPMLIGFYLFNQNRKTVNLPLEMEAYFKKLLKLHNIEDTINVVNFIYQMEKTDNDHINKEILKKLLEQDIKDGLEHNLSLDTIKDMALNKKISIKELIDNKEILKIMKRVEEVRFLKENLK